MLQLAGRSTSINVRKVVWTLGEIGQDFELLDPDGDPGRALISLNPIGLMPVLRDGEHVLWESNTVCRYLAARFGRSDLLPAEAHDRSQVELWMDWQATNLNAAWTPAFMARVRNHPDYLRDERAVAASVERWNTLTMLIDAHLADREWLALDRFTLADVVVGLSLHRWLKSPIDRPAAHHLDRYYARLAARPAMREALGAGEP